VECRADMKLDILIYTWVAINGRRHPSRRGVAGTRPLFNRTCSSSWEANFKRTSFVCTYLRSRINRHVRQPPRDKIPPRWCGHVLSWTGVCCISLERS
jgi:hypothetical protein